MQISRLTCYRIDKCGFYQRGEKTSDFGSSAEVFEQIERWSKGLELSLTKLMDQSCQSDKMPVYLVELLRCSSGWLMALWNEVPSGGGVIASIGKDSPVGSPRVYENKIEKNTIPGHPSYFWILPKKSLVVNLKFGSTVSNRQGMEDYIQDFLNTVSEYRHIVTNENGEEIVEGFKAVGSTQVKKGVHPAFRLKPLTLPGGKESLLENFEKIRKCIRVGTVTLESKIGEEFFQSFIRFLRSPSSSREKQHTETHQVRLEMDYKPTLSELEQMIVAEETSPAEGRWDDIGFVLQGESNIRWLGRLRASGTFELEVHASSVGMVQAAELVKLIDKEGDKIIQELINES
jgi:hypothetical protein